MAIDTKDKRKSVLEVSGLTLYPDPNSTLDQNDRMIISGLYGGITVDVFSSTQWINVSDSSFDQGKSTNVSSNWVQDTDTVTLES